MNNRFWKYLFPPIYGLLVYLTIRLLLDSVTGDVRTLARSYCAKGVPVQYEQYPLGHIGALGVWLPHAIDWIKDRFAGNPAPTNCAAVAKGNPLDPIPLP